MNNDLSHVEQRQLHDAMTEVGQALSILTGVMRDLVMPRLSARDYDIVRAYVGTIRSAHATIDELLYNEAVREPDLNPSVAAYKASIEEAMARIDECPPDGIERPLTTVVSDEYPDRHPCIFVGCEHTVQFDDEPYCYTHSPDSGSSVRGYSYRESKALADAHAAQQAAFVQGREPRTTRVVRP